MCDDSPKNLPHVFQSSAVDLRFFAGLPWCKGTLGRSNEGIPIQPENVLKARTPTHYQAPNSDILFGREITGEIEEGFDEYAAVEGCLCRV